MTRGQSKNRKGRNQTSLPQTPESNTIPDGRDIEFSQELADEADLKAQERSNAADARAKQK
ncbi:YfhD family protein [Bacillus solimangrovi]|uniref:YfhD family protein n=1 Tax=Bacillus solimangrovi TaxID=1305675 RepID=A0A1E5LF48_9BACI|nr:YfhD family protein [Bacillus solimangrovi]OEH92692.1 YfhD family protein [Bacillus solimangrovi]